MKEITNRSVIVVIPKNPFEKWARLYNDLSIEELEQRLRERHAYLIDWTCNENIDEVLSAYYSRIFEYELYGWNSYKKEWPQNRSYEIFLEWFEVALCDDLFDLETEIIISEKFKPATSGDLTDD